MLRTFNCGIGMVVVTERPMPTGSCACFQEWGEPPYVIGEMRGTRGRQDHRQRQGRDGIPAT